jgi:puromycin-sensitive aminopeptidase
MKNRELIMQHTHTGACRHKAPQPSKYRLPRTVVPRRYELTIESDPDRADFEGSVSIEVDVLQPVSEIKLNSLELELNNVVLERADGTSYDGTVSYDSENETATMAFNGTVGSGQWKLYTKFKGLVGSQSSGLFCAESEPDAAGATHKILCTQFEAADARRVFPCFDEPDFKATFKVNLILDRHHMALANGNGVCSVPLDGNRKLVEFEETVLMSSYLVCFTLGPLVSSDPVLVSGKELRIWSLPGNEDKTKFALEVAAFGVDYFERYFGIPYPNGHKIDLVAIPGFAWGGMENVGLIICGDYVLLVPDDAPAQKKQSEARIILHELAHQWFGDYVTMRWWNGLWLNESFATFMASKACQAWNSEINEWEQFCSGREKAYRADSIKHTHPIEETVDNARNAILLVDAISYEKGCSVLYQFEQFIGEEVFRKGISTYLKRHAFGNTEASDLWDSLEEVCHAEAVTLPIRQVLETWIKQSGHPEVLVSRSRKDGCVDLTQRPFRLLDVGRKTRKLWPIPVTFAYEIGGQVVERKLLVTKKRTTIELGQGFSWVKINAGGSGFYRVRYSQELLQALTADIDKTLTSIEKNNLLADADAFVDAGIMPSPEFFELVHSITQRSAPADFAMFNRTCAGIYGLLDEVSRKRFRKLVAKMLKQYVHKNGLEGSMAQTTEAAGNVAGNAATLLPFAARWQPFHLNLSPVIQQASKAMLKAWQADPTSLDDATAAAAAMILHFGRVEMPQEFRDKQMQNKGATPLTLQTYLVTLAELASTTTRKVNVFDLFAAAILEHSVKKGNYAAEDVIGNWTKWLEEDLGNMMISRHLRSLGSVDSAEAEAKLIELFKQHPYAPVKKEIAKAMELIRAGVLLREREGAVMAQYLERIRAAGGRSYGQKGQS